MELSVGPILVKSLVEGFTKPKDLCQLSFFLHMKEESCKLPPCSSPSSVPAVTIQHNTARFLKVSQFNPKASLSP